MTAQTIEAVSLAHAIHYAVLAFGLVGLAVLLAPRFLPVRRVADEHELRVLALAGQISSGTLGQPGSAPVGAAVESAPVGIVAGTFLPMAIISSASAAAVHAAVGPEHFRERLVFGLFFATAAIAQVAWSWAVVLRPSRRLIAAGALGNAAVLALWLVTRTVGLPFNLLPRPEALGRWDVASVIWELVVVAACLQILQRLPLCPLPGTTPGTMPGTLRTVPTSLHLPGWADWHRAVRGWTLCSMLVLVALSLSGAGS